MNCYVDDTKDEFYLKVDGELLRLRLVGYAADHESSFYYLATPDSVSLRKQTTNCSAPEIKHRLLDGFGAKAGTDYKVIGEPTDLAGARQLAISKSELAPELRRRSMFRR